jgi:dTDP-4-amino-4,6-dideoxygalactose transaminase/membrane protein DedA with SNARE-associated domain
VLLASITGSITDAITTAIGDHGLYAIFWLMLVDAVFPAASELVMLYAGALAAGAFAGSDVVLFGHEIAGDRWALVAVIAAGTLGYTIGAVIGWGIGLYGGRPLLERHGRWFHLGPDRLERADRWFDRWDDAAVLIGRLTPIARSFVSIPAGVRDAARPVHGADVGRLDDLVRRLRGRRLPARIELAPAARRLPLRRGRGAGGRRRRDRVPGAEKAHEGSEGSGAHRPDLEPLDARHHPVHSRVVSRIPLIDVKAQYAPLQDELQQAFADVLASGAFIRGPQFKAFQDEAAAYLGARRTVGVANGTDALVLVLDALGIGPGDEVVCPAFTFYATAESIVRRGATPVFVDIDPATLNVDPALVAELVSPRTKAIMPVHLFGRPAPLAELAELGVPIVEDAAQAWGAAGTAASIASTYSYYPTKNLFCLGDGGLVAVNDDDLAERISMLAFHGSRDKTDFQYVGYNSRLDELQAAFLRVFLPHVDGWNAGRREAAARYAELGLGTACELPPDEPGHVYHLFVCRSPERDRIRAALSEAGIGSAVYYTTPLHLQPALRFLGYEEGSLPETERAARENFSVPLWPTIAPEVQEEVTETVRSAVGARVAS